MEQPVHERLSGNGEVKETSTPNFVVTRIAEGFNFQGEGAISAAEEDPKTLALLDEAIYNSSRILVPVEAEDDGCSDGRPAVLVFTKQETFKRSLHRSKVFGGAVAMAAASRIGLGLTHGEQLQEVFDHSIGALTEKGVKFGAHTGETTNDSDSGCGAIDGAPKALLAVLKYESKIREMITTLGVDQTGVDKVFDNFRQYVRNTLSQAAPYSGRETMDHIVETGKVIKKLGGEHRERRIILNTVKECTVNQNLIRLVTGGKAQVFAVDTWRLEDIATKLYPNQPEKQHKAVLSELVYTIATAAVLTKGDLPIDMIEAAAS